MFYKKHSDVIMTNTYIYSNVIENVWSNKSNLNLQLLQTELFCDGGIYSRGRLAGLLYRDEQRAEFFETNSDVMIDC